MLLNTLRNFSSILPSQRALATGASAVTGFIGRGVGGAYASIITRQIAGYAIPEATATTLLQVPGAFIKNTARNVIIENLAVNAYPYGALSGGAVGMCVGAAAVQLSCYAGKAVYDYTADKWQDYQKYQEQKEHATSYESLSQGDSEANQNEVDGLEVEDGFMHLSKRTNPSIHAYSLVAYHYNNVKQQNCNRDPRSTGVVNQCINSAEVAHANPARLMYRQV